VNPDYAGRCEDRWTALVESYEQPPLDDAVEAELVEFVERRARELGDTVSIRRGPIHPARREAS
jgi:trimethylamine:corrinoid methyltransferase-like protein